MIEVRGLHKHFKKTKAVDDLSFSLEAGKVLGLLGPNGAGKTTAMRMMAGTLSIESGTVEVSGIDLANQPVEAKKLLGYLPDDPPFFEHLTCWEHIRFIASVYNVEDFEKKASLLLKRLGIEDKKNAFPNDLSKGMRQRLGLVCLFLHEPKVILMDEPMNGLDPRGINTLNELIKETASRGACVILSSHILSFLEIVVSDVLVMNHGKTCFLGTLAEMNEKVKGLNSTAPLEELFLKVTEEAS